MIIASAYENLSQHFEQELFFDYFVFLFWGESAILFFSKNVHKLWSYLKKPSSKIYSSGANLFQNENGFY